MWVLRGSKRHSVAASQHERPQKSGVFNGRSGHGASGSPCASSHSSGFQRAPSVKDLAPLAPHAGNPDPGPSLGEVVEAPASGSLINDIDRNIQEHRLSNISTGPSETLISALDMTPIRKAPVALPEATRHEPTQRRNSDGTSARQDPPLLPLPPTPPRGTVRSGSDVLFDDHGFLLERGPPSHPNSVASPRSLGDSPHGISRRSRKPGALGLQRLSAPVVGRSADTPRGLTPVRATPRDVSPPPPAPSPAPGAGHWSRRQSSSAVRRDLTLIVDDSPHTAPRPAESGLSPNAPVRPHPVAAMATSLSATPALGAADGAAHPIARTSPAVPPGASATPPSAVSVESDPAPTTDRTAPAPLIPGAESVPAHSGGPGTRGGPRLVVFSGGTAFNTVASSLSTLSTRVAHVLPVSDDGGSTAEIVRVLGGPAVGDIRSRCLRLADTRDAESLAVARLLAHRLPGTSAGAAKAEWYEIVEGDHALWEGVSEPYKHTIRAFLVHFQANILRHSSERFDFRNGSVGNFFFAGARIFFRSLEAAIFLFSRVARIPEGSVVAPAILTEERITLGAELVDGRFIRGQNAISHPPRSTDGPEAVRKDLEDPPMPARVRRVFYLSSEGTRGEHEVFPRANPRVLQELRETDAVIYGMGSLYTSICPSLVLQGVGEAVAERTCPKILVLNGAHDRETSYYEPVAGLAGKGGEADMAAVAWPGGGSGMARRSVSEESVGREPEGRHEVRRMTAADVVRAICGALNRDEQCRGEGLGRAPCDFVTAVVVPEGGEIDADPEELRSLGVEDVVRVGATRDARGRVVYNADDLVSAFRGIIARHLDMD